MFPADHPILRFGERVAALQPLRALKGLASAHLIYPIAERLEGRAVRPKREALRQHYARSWPERERLLREKLHRTLEHARAHVPYYRDLFAAIGFDPASVLGDIRRIEAVPPLTKAIILEQGERMLARPLGSAGRTYACKTGGSTGQSCVIHYDQAAADHAAAVTLYCRERIGKTKRMSELHFACRFPTDPPPRWPTRETAKEWSMNRSNIFFGRLDDPGVDEIVATLQRRRPDLVHAHPSTIHAVARSLAERGKHVRAFRIFESSGELLEPHVRAAIRDSLGCRIVDRYGLAELGVMAYQFDDGGDTLQVLDSEGYAECEPLAGDTAGVGELIFTGFRNDLMPMIRYRSGDRGTLSTGPDGMAMRDLLGRIHDMVPLGNALYPTHHVQDVLDHRVGGIEEFQIDLRRGKPVLRIVPVAVEDRDRIAQAVARSWPDAFETEFVERGALVRIGRRGKFRHVVSA